MKKGISLLLVFCIIFASAVPVFAAEGDTGTWLPYDGAEYCFTYEELADGTLSITGCDGVLLNEPFRLPESIDGKKVTEIADHAFEGCSLPGGIVIPEGIRSIGEKAFADTRDFSSDILIPASVRSIGKAAFAGCDGGSFRVDKANENYRDRDGMLFTRDLTRLLACPDSRTDLIEIPDEVTVIGEEAFKYRHVKGIVPGKNVKEIADGAFYSFHSEGTLVIPEGVESIGNHAFKYSKWESDTLNLPESLKSIGEEVFCCCWDFTGDIRIPAAVEHISTGAFESCGGNHFVVAEENQKYCSRNGLLLTKDGTTVLSCLSHREEPLTIPAGVTAIGSHAFSNCRLRNKMLVIPAAVTEIGEKAFFCSRPDPQNYNNFITLSLQEGLKMIGEDAFSCSDFGGKLEIPASVETIGEGAFSFSELSEIHVAAENRSYSSWDGMLFSKDMTELIQRPDAKAGELKLPDGVIRIADRACCGNIHMAGSLTIPDSVREIGASAFCRCEGFDGTLTLGKNLEIIGEEAFLGCSGLKGELVIPENVKVISDEAFCYNPYLPIFGEPFQPVEAFLPVPDTRALPPLICGFTSLKFLGNVETIGEGAFADCFSLKGALELPATVQEIGDYAFFSCAGLNQMSLPEGVKKIGREAFSFCSGLTGEMTLPAGVSELGCGAFESCAFTGFAAAPANEHYKAVSGMLLSADGKNLVCCPSKKACLTIPDGIETIEDFAFSCCDSSADNLVIPDSVRVIGCEAFRCCKGLTGITFGKNVSSVHTYAFIWCDNLKEIRFLSEKPPRFYEGVFVNVKADASCPATWPEEACRNYGGSLTWKRGCPGEHHLVSYEGKAPTCTEPGWAPYVKCTECGYTTYREIPALGHDWGETTYTWSGDGRTCTAKRVCRRDEAHVETADAVITIKQSKAPTCCAKGETTYTAVFSVDWAESVTRTVADISEKGHSLIPVEEVPATETEAGVKAHWKCSECGRLFADAEGRQEVSEEDLVLSQLRSFPFADVPESSWYRKTIEYVFAHRLMNGTGLTTFEPDAHLTRAMAAQILYNMENHPETAAGSPFTDVTGSWYYNAVCWASEQGCINGIGSHLFAPDEPITREQLAAILYRYEGSPETTGSLDSFRDAADASGYALAALRWASEKGILRGDQNQNLSPADFATRAEVAAMFMRFCLLPG